MQFHPRKCLFRVSLKKIEFTGSVTPKNREKVGAVYGFPAKLGEWRKTHISVKSRDIDTKFESYVETEAYTLDFGSKANMAAAAI
jgi:rRNA processing protein Gar1